VKLFSYCFTGSLTSQQCERLRQTTGMVISLHAAVDREPGQGTITPGVKLYLSAGATPDSWSIEAWSYDDQEFDHAAVTDMRAKIRKLLPEISVDWTECPPAA
jgi:hypothetical protein